MKESFPEQFVRYYSQSMRRLVKAVALSVLSGMIVTLPVRSADKLYFDYGILGRQISASSLETFATDGTIDAELAPYLHQISPENRQELQRILSTPLVELSDGMPEQIGDPFVLSQWLYSPIGEIVLASVGQLIQTQGRQNGQQAIRAAMVLAAADPAGLSLINILRFYPTNGLRLNLPQVSALSDAIRTNIETTDSLVQATIQQSVAVAATEPVLDYQALPMLADVPQFEVVNQSLVLEDRDRNRTYPTDLYLPADLNAVPEPIPVMVFSHGYGDTRTNSEKYFYLAQNLSHTSALTRAILDLAYPRSGIVESFNASEQWLFTLMVTLLIAHGQVSLMGDETYNPYLTAAYVEAVSVEPTRLHLLRSWPLCLSGTQCAEN